MRRCGFGRSKRGSILIFLTFILVSITSAVIVFTVDARERAEESYQRMMTDIACRSVLAEYDIRLKDDYGIFAFRGDDKYVSQKISQYLRYARRHSETVFSLDNGGTHVDTSKYRITNTDIFEEQITEAAKYGFLKADRLFEKSEVNGTEQGKSAYNAGKEGCGDRSGRAFNPENLPSKKYCNSGLNVNTKGLTSGGLKGLLSGTGKNFLINSYIFSVFGNYCDEKETTETYYKYEIEYLIAGRTSDSENLSKVKQYFITLRTPINVAKIYADPVRSAKALAEAEALTPGPAAHATQLAIITVWAAEDAEEDWKTVISGGEVDGLSYSDYLTVFLTMQDREIKLLRIMDLIQLNLGLSYYEDFLIAEHACGFELSIILDGRTREYAHCY